MTTKATPLSIIIALFLFTGICVFMYKIQTKPVSDVSRFNFKGKIYKITKQYRGRFDLSVSLKDDKKILLIDQNLGVNSKLIMIGDSVIKERYSSCFAYYRNNILILNDCNARVDIDSL